MIFGSSFDMLQAVTNKRGFKKKKNITIWGYNEGSNLATTTTVPQISIEVFWQVNFEPLTIPPNCDGFFFFCSILFHLSRPITYQKESRNSFAKWNDILIGVRHICSFLTI